MKNSMYVGDASKYIRTSGLSAEFDIPIKNELRRDNFFNDGDGLTPAQVRGFAQRMHEKGMKVTDALDNQSIFFNRALEFFTAEIYEVKYENLPFRKVFPVINRGGPGVKEITSEVYDYFAKAAVVNGSGKDVPVVDYGGKEIKFPVKMWGIAAEWTIQELQSFVIAQQNNRARISPELGRQKAALRGIEEALNDQAFFGDGGNDMPGFMNHPLIPTGVVSTGINSSTEWQNKTPDEIIADISSLGSFIWSQSKMREKPDTLLLPPSKWNYLHDTRLDNREISIMEYILRTSAFFKNESDIVPVNEYENAGINGTGKMSAFCKDEERISVEIPEEAQSLPVQLTQFTYKMFWYAYSAGCVVRYPRSAAHSEGI